MTTTLNPFATTTPFAGTTPFHTMNNVTPQINAAGTCTSAASINQAAINAAIGSSIGNPLLGNPLQGYQTSQFPGCVTTPTGQVVPVSTLVAIYGPQVLNQLAQVTAQQFGQQFGYTGQVNPLVGNWNNQINPFVGQHVGQYGGQYGAQNFGQFTPGVSNLNGVTPWNNAAYPTATPWSGTSANAAAFQSVFPSNLYGTSNGVNPFINSSPVNTTPWTNTNWNTYGSPISNAFQSVSPSINTPYGTVPTGQNFNSTSFGFPINTLSPVSVWQHLAAQSSIYGQPLSHLTAQTLGQTYGQNFGQNYGQTFNPSFSLNNLQGFGLPTYGYQNLLQNCGPNCGFQNAIPTTYGQNYSPFAQPFSGLTNLTPWNTIPQFGAPINAAYSTPFTTPFNTPFATPFNTLGVTGIVPTIYGNLPITTNPYAIPTNLYGNNCFGGVSPFVAGLPTVIPGTPVGINPFATTNPYAYTGQTNGVPVNGAFANGFQAPVATPFPVSIDGSERQNKTGRGNREA